MARSRPAQPVRLAVVDDFEIVVAGIARMLAPYDQRVQVVEIDAGPPRSSEVDLVLFDTLAQALARTGARAETADTAEDPGVKTVIFSWNLDPTLVRTALAAGAAGYLSKGLRAPELVEALERVHVGEVVMPPDTAPPDVAAAPGETGDWPGRGAGLSAREAETVALITRGLSNHEIAERSMLSINSVKTYIRSAYRKMGVQRRSQAVLWGLQHGFDHEGGRADEPPPEGTDLTRRAPRQQDL